MAKAKKTAAKTKKITTRANNPLAALVADAVSRINALGASLQALGLGNLTTDDRIHSNGKLRDGEEDAMGNVLDVVDAFPDRFAAIAARDHGSDDAVVETAPARAALARRAVVAPLYEALSAAGLLIGDDMLSSASTAKDVTGPAYAIIKANAVVDPALRKAAASALSFYGKAAQKAARTKKAKKNAGGSATPTAGA